MRKKHKMQSRGFGSLPELKQPQGISLRLRLFYCYSLCLRGQTLNRAAPQQGVCLGCGCTPIMT